MGKLDGLKDGDIVEITHRAVVWKKPDRDFGFRPFGTDTNRVWGMEIVNDAHFSIKRVEPPLQPGDTVRRKTEPGISYELLAIRGDSAVLWGPVYDSGPSGVATAYGVFLRDIERVP
jgi:hypothetical protein